MGLSKAYHELLRECDPPSTIDEQVQRPSRAHPLVGTVVGLGPLKGWEEAVVDVDGVLSMFAAEVLREHLRRQNGALGRSQCWWAQLAGNKAPVKAVEGRQANWARRWVWGRNRNNAVQVHQGLAVLSRQICKP